MERQETVASPFDSQALVPESCEYNGNGQVFWLVQVRGVFPITNISDMVAADLGWTYSYGHSS